MTSWTRRSRAALAICVLLLAGAAGCDGSGARGSTPEESPTPVGKLIDHTDEEGRPYREVDRTAAPEVGVEVRPDAGGNWDVRLTVRRFRFSPAGTAAHATVGRGVAHVLVDGRLVGRLRAPEFRLSARLVPRGTHHVTARLYADDGTVWAVAGQPVQSTADITASAPSPGTPATPDLPAVCPTGTASAAGVADRAGVGGTAIGADRAGATASTVTTPGLPCPTATASVASTSGPVGAAGAAPAVGSAVPAAVSSAGPVTGASAVVTTAGAGGAADAAFGTCTFAVTPPGAPVGGCASAGAGAGVWPAVS